MIYQFESLIGEGGEERQWIKEERHPPKVDYQTNSFLRASVFKKFWLGDRKKFKHRGTENMEGVSERKKFA
jgi:hypothetical protein